ncbi:peptide ABC transporter substrate-binding protein [Paenibacillus nasutitermitis]|uniref:Peptide ABC transporter substrate-binding protein n=1 Tax=Paenibacillus nasutitermitis TaxID=1652958 RepID=A0A916ZC93_9BACL|nr:peptide ABC transporter substrate-binding protein [Paenibacillus nasutitermitis]GGD88090.1 peptide ABC transporter substrate-binding protein [Paenibacillus nasutitermitis]
MKLKPFMSGIVILTLLGSILAACGNNDAGSNTGTNGNAGNTGSSKKELVMNYRADPPALDVSIADTSAAFTILGAISEGLYRLDKDLKPQPAIAESLPEISEDGLTYTIKLRSGLTWEDGSPLTANDFVYSYRRTLDPATKATYAFMVAWIKGGNDILNAKSPEAVEAAKEKLGVEAKDDTTLVITLDHPVPFFTDQLAFLNFYPQNEKFVEAQGDSSGADADKVLGAGPFKLVTWNHEQSLVLEKNDKYWDAANVQLEKVTLNIVKDTNTGLNLYETGETDYTDVKGDQMKDYDGKPDLQMKNELVTGYINFQQKKVPAFANAKVRQAFSMAVDRKGLADLVLMNGSVPSTGYVPNGNQDGNGKEFRAVVGDTEVAFDAAKAKALLEEGLKESGATLPKLSIIGDDTETGKKLLEYIVQQWKTNLGVDVAAEPLPHANRVDRETSKNYTIVSSLWGADYNDPMTWLDLYVSGGPFNTQDWSNAEYDKLIKDAQTQTDLAKRAEEMAQAEKILMEEAAVFPLFFRSSPFVINPALKDLILPPYGPDFELKWAHY